MKSLKNMRMPIIIEFTNDNISQAKRKKEKETNDLKSESRNK